MNLPNKPTKAFPTKAFLTSMVVWIGINIILLSIILFLQLKLNKSTDEALKGLRSIEYTPIEEVIEE